VFCGGEQYPFRNASCAAVKAEITLTISPERVALREQLAHERDARSANNDVEWGA
jgi:hypothetical protein